MKRDKEAKFVSIADIQGELGCKIDRARDIMLFELPHHDIRAAGARRATWRAKRKDLEAWLAGRAHRPEREALQEFSRKFVT